MDHKETGAPLELTHEKIEIMVLAENKQSKLADIVHKDKKYTLKAGKKISIAL